MSANKRLTNIYNMRSERIQIVMKQKNIRSLRELSRLTGIDLCGLSKGVNGDGHINEKNARRIEQILDLPFLFLDGVNDIEREVPVYSIKDYNTGTPSYFISKALKEEAFFIQITEENTSICAKPGYRLLFEPKDDMFEININDICLFKHEHKHRIGLYKGLGFLSNNVNYSTSMSQLVARCSTIYL